MLMVPYRLTRALSSSLWFLERKCFTGGAVTLGADGGSSDVTLQIDDTASGLSTINGQGNHFGKWRRRYKRRRSI